MTESHQQPSDAPAASDELPPANRALMAFAAWLVYECSRLDEELSPLALSGVLDADQRQEFQQEEADARLLALIAAARARLRVIGRTRCAHSGGGTTTEE